jgi:hypothetical protein
MLVRERCALLMMVMMWMMVMMMMCVCSFAEIMVLVHFIILVLLWLTRDPEVVPGWQSLLPKKWANNFDWFWFSIAG